MSEKRNDSADMQARLMAARDRLKTAKQEAEADQAEAALPSQQKTKDDLHAQMKAARDRMKQAKQGGGQTADEQKQEERKKGPTVLILNASEDKMHLELLFHNAPDGAETLPPVYEEVLAAIQAKGVTHGINEVALRALCDNPVYSRAFTVASGLEAKTGADGYLKYLVRTERDLRPKLREDGTADYRDLGFIQNAEEGQPLCEIHLPEKGEDGYDIYGGVREGLYGKEPKSPAGKNTAVSEDGTMLVATSAGSVEVRNGVIDIMEVFRINGNVDNSTGDIDFVGDIIITGDVLVGFHVRSQGSVTVNGSVEGAHIEAAHDLVVGEGINGGSAIAGHSMKCRYIQSCQIQVGSDIFADTIMHCDLECGGNVELTGKRARLIGGKSVIAGQLVCEAIGTDSHIATQITMAGGGTQKTHEIAEYQNSIDRIDADSRKLVQVMARSEELVKQGRITPEQLKSVAAAKENYMMLLNKREELQERIETTKKEQMELSANSFIKCKNRAHVGVQITFGPLTMSVKNSFVNSRIFVVDEEIRVRPI